MIGSSRRSGLNAMLGAALGIAALAGAASAQAAPRRVAARPTRAMSAKAREIADWNAAVDRRKAEKRGRAR
jgi:hypothetical protein